MKYRVVNSKDVLKDKRFDGSYHNADSNIYDAVITSHSKHTLDYYCSDIFTSGRNKRVYTTPEYGYPFLSNSDASALNPFVNCKYSSKKYGYDESSLLKKGMILTGRVGAIGQTTFVPQYWEQYKAMGSDNIIRIAIKPEFKNGFIYAYLASRIGNLSFWKHATGGVQPFITDKMVGGLPIPDFNDDLKVDIDSLIQEVSSLRGEAMNDLIKAHNLLETSLSIPNFLNSTKVSFKSIFASHNKRFEASFNVSRNRQIYNYITSNITYKTIGELSEKTFKPNIFKRTYVQKNGVELLGGADMMNAIPQTQKLISKGQVANMPELKLEKGWILVTRAGTIGNTVYVDKQLAEKVISEDVLRIVPKEH